MYLEKKLNQRLVTAFTCGLWRSFCIWGMSQCSKSISFKLEMDGFSGWPGSFSGNYVVDFWKAKQMSLPLNSKRHLGMLYVISLRILEWKFAMSFLQSYGHMVHPSLMGLILGTLTGVWALTTHFCTRNIWLQCPQLSACSICWWIHLRRNGRGELMVFPPRREIWLMCSI